LHLASAISRFPNAITVHYSPNFISRAAIKFTLKLAEETEAFQSLGTTYAAGPDPACTEFEFRSDDYWRCVLVQQTVGWIHMGGTAAMGSDTSESVVDSKLRLEV
jgi:choline dehydrogenase-like flavoprotein